MKLSIEEICKLTGQTLIEIKRKLSQYGKTIKEYVDAVNEMVELMNNLDEKPSVYDKMLPISTKEASESLVEAMKKYDIKDNDKTREILDKLNRVS